MLLGLLLGAATVGGVGGAPFVTSSSFLLYVPLLIPLSVLAIPFLDAVLAIARRTWRRQSIFLADKEHLHHRLMDLGHGHREAVIARTKRYQAAKREKGRLGGSKEGEMSEKRGPA